MRLQVERRISERSNTQPTAYVQYAAAIGNHRIHHNGVAQHSNRRIYFLEVHAKWNYSRLSVVQHELSRDFWTAERARHFEVGVRLSLHVRDVLIDLWNKIEGESVSLNRDVDLPVIREPWARHSSQGQIDGNGAGRNENWFLTSLHRFCSTSERLVCVAHVSVNLRNRSAVVDEVLRSERAAERRI